MGLNQNVISRLHGVMPMPWNRLLATHTIMKKDRLWPKPKIKLARADTKRPSAMMYLGLTISARTPLRNFEMPYTIVAAPSTEPHCEFVK